MGDAINQPKICICFMIKKIETKNMPEPIIKQYVVGASGNYFVAINDKFQPIKESDSVVIIGRIIELRKIDGIKDEFFNAALSKYAMK